MKPVSAYSAYRIECGDVLQIDADDHEVDSDWKYLGEDVSTCHFAKAFRRMRCKLLQVIGLDGDAHFSLRDSVFLVLQAAII